MDYGARPTQHLFRRNRRVSARSAMKTATWMPRCWQVELPCTKPRARSLFPSRSARV